ncbi:hypothetical protein STAR110904_06770 [Staphylococcus argensis]
MNQVLSILKSIAEPLTKPETYQHFTSKAIMVIVYLIVAWIVIRILNKIIQQFFKLQNRGNKGNKKRSKTLARSEHRQLRRMVYRHYDHLEEIWY